MGAKLPKLPKARYEAGRPSPYLIGPPLSQSADAEIAAAGTKLRDWARHLADNSSIAAAVLSSRVSNAIGSGLTYEPLVRNRSGELLQDLNDRIRRIHERWSRAVDVTGELTRQELERLAWRTWDVDGETFVREVVRRESDTDVPYQLQMIETDWLPFTVTRVWNDNAIVHSVEKNQWGRPIAYYVDPRRISDIYGYTPSGLGIDPDSMIRVPASEMFHVKRMERPNQSRGVTLFHAVIFRIADIAEFSAAHRLAARASADLFMSINRAPDMSTEEIPDDRTFQIEHLKIIDELAPGETANFHDPRHPNQNAVDFVREELRSVAAACDVGFSQIAQVFDSSYAAQRLEVVDTFRKADRDRSKFIADFARPGLYERPVEMAIMAGMIPQRLLRQADQQTLLDCRIDGPQMPVIDPVKDRQAYALDQENGWDSRHGIIRRMGKQPAQVDAERSQDEPMAADQEDTTE